MNIKASLLSSIRPNTWLRIWSEMILGAVLASYPYFNLKSFFLTFIATSPLLWSAAYLINDLTDIKLDKQHPLRAKRAYTIEKIGKTKIILFTNALIFFALIIGIFINKIVFTLLLMLLVSQLIYTLPPLRLKEKFLWDIIVNSLNSFLRFLLGWFSQSIIHSFPFLVLLFVVFLKTLLFFGHRLQNRDLEKKNKIKSTTASLSMDKIYFILGFLFLISLSLYLLCLIKGIFPLISAISVPISVFPLIFYLFRTRNIKIFLSVEKNLTFRNYLYFGMFIFSNITAFFIIYYKR